MQECQKYYWDRKLNKTQYLRLPDLAKTEQLHSAESLPFTAKHTGQLTELVEVLRGRKEVLHCQGTSELKKEHCAGFLWVLLFPGEHRSLWARSIWRQMPRKACFSYPEHQETGYQKRYTNLFDNTCPTWSKHHGKRLLHSWPSNSSWVKKTEKCQEFCNIQISHNILNIVKILHPGKSQLEWKKTVNGCQCQKQQCIGVMWQRFSISHHKY